MYGHELDRALEAVARRQHGAFHRRQVVALGFTSRMIQHRRHTGTWLTLDRSLYALPSHPFSWMRQAKAAELAIPGAAVSHRAAAVLHGIDGFRPGGLDVTVPRTGTNRTELATVHRSTQFDVVQRELISVTTVARTIADLSGQLDVWRLERAIDDVLLSRRATVVDLLSEADRAAHGHQASVAHLRELIDDRGDGYVPPASELEALLYAVLDSPRLPAFVRQAPFPWWPEAPQRVDGLIPEWKVIAEADGRRWHTRRADFERDRKRDHLAQRHGYQVLRFTYRQLVANPGYAVDVLLDVGRHREPAAAA